MEVENVLLALEEKNKWIRRREKLQKRLEKVRKQKRTHLDQLDDVIDLRLDGALRGEDDMPREKESKGMPDIPTAPPLR